MKQRPNAWINIAAFAAGIVSGVSGIVRVALVALVLVHLVVHWCWIKKLPRILSKPRKKATLTAVATDDVCEVNAG